MTTAQESKSNATTVTPKGERSKLQKAARVAMWVAGAATVAAVGYYGYKHFTVRRQMVVVTE